MITIVCASCGHINTFERGEEYICGKCWLRLERNSQRASMFCKCERCEINFMTRKIRYYCKECTSKIKKERNRTYEKYGRKPKRKIGEMGDIIKMREANRAKIERIKLGDFEPEAAYI